MEFAATVVILTCTYALLAAGIVILYKAGRVVNFAHGELAIVGGYVFYSCGLMAGDESLWLAIAGALAFSIAMGLVIYMTMMRRLVGEPFYVAILVTVGLGIVLKSAILVIWRAERLTIDVGVAPAVRLAGGATLSYMDIASVLLTIAFFAGLYLFFRCTRLGVQFRGTAENPLLASQRGVNVKFRAVARLGDRNHGGVSVRRAVRRAGVPEHRERHHRPGRLDRGAGRRARQPARRRGRRLRRGARAIPDRASDQSRFSAKPFPSSSCSR